MGINSTICWALLAVGICFLEHSSTLANNNKKSYIVYLGIHSHGLRPNGFDVKMATQSHYNLLESVLGSHEKAIKSMEYSYNKYINGFVAKLTEDDIQNIKKSANVVSVFENGRSELHTTRSWEFLGLEQNGVTPSDSLWNKTTYGDDVIIGNIDTGVWPESKSFNDEGLGPIPSKWKGECMTGSDTIFKCNKKLIGARYFDIARQVKIPMSPRDFHGHGTHTLSTAGGSFVKDANLEGLPLGVAKGGSPNARVAAYKACWPRYWCKDANFLAAFEAAIGDEVDVLSISQGKRPVKDFKEDVLAIGSYHAVRHGISVVLSAGNDGPEPGNVINVAPWMFTVGASTLDRRFVNKVYLGNSTLQFKGAGFGPQKLLPKGYFHPIIDGASSSKNSSTTDIARYCGLESLDPSKVKGKILVCQKKGGDYSFRSDIIRTAGVGLILVNDALGLDVIEPRDYGIPASHLHYKDGQALLEYIKNTQNPTAYIADTETKLNMKPAPTMAHFSSRGPAMRYRQILKPDVIAPGVDIIAADRGSANDMQRHKYSLRSGTSMSCPHVAGVVGLLKSMHPEWSPAAIRSAIMTTATTFANDNKPILDYNGEQATPFAYGAGHINPNDVADPGLVYNLIENDYLDFLCSIYTERDLKLFTPIPYKCNNSKSILDFNYPSITVNNFSTLATLTRRLTIVGSPATYEVKVIAPSGVNVTVVPSNLKFNRTGEELVYVVELKRQEELKETGYVFGSLVWSDGSHNVTSPLVVEKV